MPELDWSASWISDALASIDKHLHAHGAEMAEARAAGVSESRIEALYPFAPEDYYAGVQRLFADPASHSQLAPIFSRGSVWQTVVTQLPWSERARCEELRDHRDQTPDEIFYLTTKKLMFENVLMLPLVLRILLRYPFSSTADWPTRMGPAALEATLPLLKEVTVTYVKYLDAHLSVPR